MEATAVPVSRYEIPGLISSSWSASGSAAKYTVDECRPIGRGTFGEIILAWRSDDPTSFLAAKYMFLRGVTGEQKERADNEIRYMKRLKHFACVGIIDSIDDPAGETTVLILEYVDAGDLARHIDKRRGTWQYFGNDDIITIFLQLVLGLHHIHSNKMLHRDIKSSNVLVSSNGLVKIGDFGLSKVYETISGDIGNHTVCGTPLYLPPEQWLKQRYGKAADIWELGVLMYELIELRWPYMGADLDELRHAICNRQHIPISHGPPDVAELVEWMLQKNPSLRPSTDQLLRSPVLLRSLSRFPELVNNTKNLSEESKANVLKSLHEVKHFIITVPPTSVCKEGWVKKLKGKDRLEDRYFVLSGGCIELLHRADSTRGRAPISISQFKNFQLDVDTLQYFKFENAEGREYHFFAEDADEWAHALSQAAVTISPCFDVQKGFLESFEEQ